jgi:hypothetical protein
MAARGGRKERFVKTLNLPAAVLGVASFAAGAHMAAAQPPISVQIEPGPRVTDVMRVNECEEICNSSRGHPAMYLRFRQLSLPPRYCLQKAADVVRNAGLANTASDAVGSGGTLGTARAAITCVRLPNAGPCGGDGATVMFIAASNQDAAEANALLDRLDTSFGSPVLFDCN